MPLQYSWNVLQCNPGVFCCRASYDKSNCCNDTSALVNTSHIGTLLLPGGKEVNTTYVAPASSSRPSLPPSPSAGAVGGVVGGVLGAALLVAITAIILLLRRHKVLTHALDTKTALLSAAYEHQQAANEKINDPSPFPSNPAQQPFYGQQGQVYFNQGAPDGAPPTGVYPNSAPPVSVPPQRTNFAQDRPYEMDGNVGSGPGGYHEMSDERQSESMEPSN
jgi:hypothetical protein